MMLLSKKRTQEELRTLVVGMSDETLLSNYVQVRIKAEEDVSKSQYYAYGETVSETLKREMLVRMNPPVAEEPVTGPVLLRINKLSEMTKYEDPKTSDTHHGLKKWTKDVPILMVDDKGKQRIINKWVYINKNDELVYDKKNNLWTQGAEHYDIGKSHIKDVYIVIGGPMKEEEDL